MKKIYKYEIHPEGNNVFDPGLNPLHVDCVDDKIFMWAEVDDDLDCYAMEFFAYPTGHMEIPEGWYYLGTVLMNSGRLVWHIYFKPMHQTPSTGIRGND